MASVEIRIDWFETRVDITETSSRTRLNVDAPAGLLAISVVRACDAAGISIEDLGKQLIQESMRRREEAR